MKNNRSAVAFSLFNPSFDKIRFNETRNKKEIITTKNRANPLDDKKDAC